MKMTDLTPSTYLRRASLRSAARFWAVAVGVCVLVAVVPIGIQSMRAPDHTAALASERLAQAQTQLDQARAMTESVSRRLKQHQRELSAGDHLTRRPDWSDMLGRVAHQFDQDLMMTGLRLGTPRDSKVRTGLGQAAQDAPDDSVWLIVGGVAESHSEVPGLILRLESLGLFEQVVMTGTWRETYAGVPRTSFLLACRVQ